MVQYNTTPWVILFLVVLAGCVLTGMLLGNVGPFNSQVVLAEISAKQTQDAFVFLATQTAFGIAQTQQAPMIQQTAIIALMTAVPLQQTATQIAVLSALQIAQANAVQTKIVSEAQNEQMMVQATQTSLANDSYLQNLASNTTATAMTQNQIQSQQARFAGPAIITIMVLLICGWIVVHAFSQIATARAKEKEAHARLLAEQHRQVTSQGAIQAQKDVCQHPRPASLMKNPNTGKGLPKVE